MPWFASIQGSTGFGRVVQQQQQPSSGYIFYRWLITATKTMPPNGNACQASEFVFQLNGTDQQATTSSATVTSNPTGTFNTGEEPQRLVDNNLTTKMCDTRFVTNGNQTGIIFQFSSRQTFTGYRWATANDFQDRDPSSWTISGSQDGTTWTLLHTVTGYIATSSRNTYNPAFAFTGGSLYFDGTTTGRLTIANDIDFRNGTGDFTIEWFMYPIANTNSFPRVFQIGNFPGSIGVSFEGSDSAGRDFYFWASGAILIASSTRYIDNWYHIAISRTGTSLRVFVNGTILGGTLTNSTNFSDATNALSIGNETTAITAAAFEGYITNFRWVKGTALYTANFTRPTAPLQPVSGSSLLLLAASSGTATTDSSGKGKTVTNGGSVTWDSRTPFS